MKRGMLFGIVPLLLMICLLLPVFFVHQIKATNPPNTLADTLNSLISSDTFPLSTPFLSGGVNELQLGIIFGKYSSSVYDQMAQALLNARSWLCLIELKRAAEVSGYDSTVLDSAVKQALNNIPMVGSLPSDNGQFWTTEGFLMWGYKYAQQLGVSRWDPQAAFTQLASIIDQDGGGFESSGSAVNQGSTRYYDEQAETLRDCYILYLEGVTEAKAYCDKLWNHLLNDGWWDPSGGWFWYRPAWQCFECEMGKFASVISWYLGSPPSQVVSDLNQKLLIKGWNSAGWSNGTDVIVHAANPDGSAVNSQLRPVETMMAWRALQATYPYMSSAEQASMVNMLTGNAWSCALGSGAFSGTGDQSPGLMTLFLMGIIPGTASLNTGYDEEFYDDNEISFPSNEYRFDYADRTITIPVQGPGQMQFNFGTTLASANFPGTGIYNVTFSNDWNIVTEINGVQTAPFVSLSPSSVVKEVGQSQLFTSTVLFGTSPYTYQWYQNNTLVSGATNPTWTFTPTSTGSYTVYVSVTDSVGTQITSNIATVTAVVPLSASVSPSSVALDVGQSQLFTAIVTGGTSPYTYQWYLNGAPVSGSTGSSWTFTPSSLTFYTVYVNVTDALNVAAKSSTARIQTMFLKGPYYAWWGVEYWIIRLPGERAIRLISNY